MNEYVITYNSDTNNDSYIDSSSNNNSYNLT